MLGLGIAGFLLRHLGLGNIYRECLQNRRVRFGHLEIIESTSKVRVVFPQENPRKHGGNQYSDLKERKVSKDRAKDRN